MKTFKPFRFGVISYNILSKDGWVARAKRAEELGYSILLVPDHPMQQFAPVPALLAAAEATHSIRIGSYVFNNDFHHPVMLVKNAATLDVLSHGRFELGIGAGYDRSEYEQCGILYDPAPVRVRRLGETVQIIKSLFSEEPASFSGDYYTINNLNGFPKPLQRPHPPLLIGGAGKQLLSLAAKEASIVSIGARARKDGSGLEETNTTSEATAQKLEWIRQAAGARFETLELNVLIYAVVITTERVQSAQQLTERFKATSEQILTIPHILIGTPDQICDDLLERRERYGISYISVFENTMEEFAPIVARLSGK